MSFRRMHRAALVGFLVILLGGGMFIAPAGAQETSAEDASTQHGSEPETSTQQNSTPEASEPGAVHGRHDLHVALYAGWWNFDDAFRYEDDALFGMTFGAWVTPGVSLEIDLEPMRTRNERVGEWVQAVFVNLHARLQYKPEATLSPGVLLGVSFMAADNEKTENSITEGFDIGPVLAIKLGQSTSLLVEGLFRYASVRVNYQTENGSLLQDDAVEYVWSGGLRMGVDFAF